ncbi:MAG: STAS domain-containing protein [Pirellulales bacterium]|nr:STAS domain-containing protein [Pirellulales bacterium]
MSDNHAGKTIWGTAQQDLLASLVVFLVALPLCMGIAIASGVPVEEAAAVGIITGIVGGVVTGALAGCSLQVSGPAAGLAVLVSQYWTQMDRTSFALVVLLAGTMQVVCGALRFGQWFRAVSPAIVQGMLSGIGVLILASQLHVMVDDRPPGSGRSFGGIINLATVPVAVYKGLTQGPHYPAALVGVLTIVSVVSWSWLRPKRLAMVPAPLIGVGVATVSALILESFGLDPKNIHLPDKLATVIHVPDLYDEARQRIELAPLLSRSVWIAAVTLAFVASAESLLTAVAVDSMQQHAPRTNLERELVAQGAGNIVCGLLGVLPITGVIVRSTANVLAGARTRLSTILHGVWLLVFVAVFPNVLLHVPVASLAAILVYTGWKLMRPRTVLELARFGRGEVLTYLGTLTVVVVVDLLTGLVVGFGLAVAQLLYRFSHLEIQLDTDPARQRSVLRLQGAATFLKLPKLAASLDQVPPGSELHVNLEGLWHIDHACLDLLMNWEEQQKANGGALVIDWERFTARFQPSNGNGPPPLPAPPAPAPESKVKS